MTRTIVAVGLMLAAVSFAQSAEDAGSAVVPRPEYGADTITGAFDGFGRKQLRDEGYQLVRGPVLSVKTPDPKHTVVVVSDHGKKQTVRFTHPPKLKIPIAVKADIEIEVGERKGGFEPFFSTPYVRVQLGMNTVLLCNTDGTGKDDPSMSRADRNHDVNETVSVMNGTTKLGGLKVNISPDAWFAVTAGEVTWLVWQHIEALRPDAPPAKAARTARNESCFVRQP